MVSINSPAEVSSTVEVLIVVMDGEVSVVAAGVDVCGVVVGGMDVDCPAQQRA